MEKSTLTTGESQREICISLNTHQVTEDPVVPQAPQEDSSSEGPLYEPVARCTPEEVRNNTATITHRYNDIKESEDVSNLPSSKLCFGEFDCTIDEYVKYSKDWQRKTGVNLLQSHLSEDPVPVTSPASKVERNRNGHKHILQPTLQKNTDRIASGMIGPLDPSKLKNLPVKFLIMSPKTSGNVEIYLKDPNNSSVIDTQHLKFQIDELLQFNCQEKDLLLEIGIFNARVHFLRSYFEADKLQESRNFDIVTLGKILLHEGWICLEHLYNKLQKKTVPFKPLFGKTPILTGYARKLPLNEKIREIENRLVKSLGNLEFAGVSGVFDELIHFLANIDPTTYALIDDCRNAVNMWKHIENINEIEFEIFGKDKMPYGIRNILDLGRRLYIFLEKVLPIYVAIFEKLDQIKKN